MRWWQDVRGATASIYGTIVGGAVMASGEDGSPVGEVAAAVLVTLIIYWAAERWSQVLGGQVAGEPLRVRRVFRVFADGWPMVQASYLPLAVMALATFCGATEDLSVTLALVSIVVLLVAFGTLAGRRTGLTGWRLVFAAVVTGGFGVALIVLKALLH